MKVLLDHNVPRQLAPLLKGREIRTARQMSWDELRNGDLLRSGGGAGFEAMVTGDQSIFYQQNNKQRRIALVVLSNADCFVLEYFASEIVDALAKAQAGSFARVVLPRRPREARR